MSQAPIFPPGSGSDHPTGIRRSIMPPATRKLSMVMPKTSMR